MVISSQQIEKHVLGGLIKFPSIFADIDSFLTEKDFYWDVHETIYCVLRDSYLKNERIDKVLLAQKIKNLGISFKDDINIFDYIENLAFSQINTDATVKACQELVKIRIRREIQATSAELIKFVESNGEKPINEIISSCDGLYNQKISSYGNDLQPINLFEGLEEEIELLGNSPQEEAGIKTPFSEFNRLFGGLKNGNIYAFVSRPAMGKSSVINELCFKASLATNFKIPALILDTEMDSKDVKYRILASITGVPMWYIETGNWRKNPDFFKKIRAAWPLIKNYRYHHLQVANKSVDQICSMVRRWYYSKVGRGNPAIVAYDYIKLTGEKVGNNWAEHQAIGEKINRLKELISELNIPLITAMQLNRTGESFNKKAADVTDDSSAIALSDRLQWFASFVAIFRRKTLDEIVEDGKEFGTHKMVPLKTRFQGKDAAGHIDMVKRPMADGTFKYVNNYLNFNVENFRVEEKGSLKTIIENKAERYKLEDKPNPEDSESLL